MVNLNRLNTHRHNFYDKKTCDYCTKLAILEMLNGYGNNRKHNECHHNEMQPPRTIFSFEKWSRKLFTCRSHRNRNYVRWKWMTIVIESSVIIDRFAQCVENRRNDNCVVDIGRKLCDKKSKKKIHQNTMFVLHLIWYRIDWFSFYFWITNARND